jgi:hypothetical protein
MKNLYLDISKMHMDIKSLTTSNNIALRESYIEIVARLFVVSDLGIILRDRLLKDLHEQSV